MSYSKDLLLKRLPSEQAVKLYKVILKNPHDFTGYYLAKQADCDPTTVYLILERLYQANIIFVNRREEAGRKRIHYSIHPQEKQFLLKLISWRQLEKAIEV